MRKFLSVVTLLLMGAVLIAGPVQAEDLEDLLVQVGEDYGRAYASPLIEAFGPNQNSAQYQSAHIPWGGLVFGVGVKVMATHLNEGDQTFKTVLEDVDLGDYDPAYAGQTGDIVMQGPTLFGSTSEYGTVTGYLNGLPAFEMEALPGLIDSRFVPMATPEGSIGGIFGLKGTVRWFPEVQMSSYGKTKYFGYGLQWSPNGLLTNFPIDLMAGFFDQELKVGTLVDSTAKTFFLAASKDLGSITVFGGWAKEESEMTISYVYEGDGSVVTFNAAARQESRLTLGVALGALSVEMAHGDLTTYSAGLMFGF